MELAEVAIVERRIIIEQVILSIARVMAQCTVLLIDLEFKD